MEGPETIAAILMESVTGTNGIFVPPKGYLKGALDGTGCMADAAQACASCATSTAF